MPKVSVNILTKDRAELLSRALESISRQSFRDFEVVVVNDGSTDNTAQTILTRKHFNILTIEHKASLGITASRQEALVASQGEYVAILDDDDEWVNQDKLKKQVEFLDNHREYVLVGGSIKISNFPAFAKASAGGQFPISNEISNPKFQFIKHRPPSDSAIRSTMLFRNPFFTSTVMFRREAALSAGGFVKDEYDLAEDYDLWLRLGKKGKMANFKEVFALYRQSNYNKDRRKQFFKKQLKLAIRHKGDYPYFIIAKLILRFRLL